MMKILKARGATTSAGALPLQAAISGVADGENFDVLIRIYSLTAAKKIQFAIEDTVDNFSNAVTRFVHSIEGPVNTQGPIDIRVKRRDIVATRFGVGSAELRLNVTAIDAATSCDWEAFIEDQGGAVVA